MALQRGTQMHSVDCEKSAYSRSTGPVTRFFYPRGCAGVVTTFPYTQLSAAIAAASLINGIVGLANDLVIVGRGWNLIYRV